MKSRRQALKLCLNTAVVVVIKIFNEFLLEVFHRLELLQIEQFTFEQTEEVFYHSIVMEGISEWTGAMCWLQVTESFLAGARMGDLTIREAWGFGLKEGGISAEVRLSMGLEKLPHLWYPNVNIVISPRFEPLAGSMDWRHRLG